MNGVYICIEYAKSRPLQLTLYMYLNERKMLVLYERVISHFLSYLKF